jgi:protein transport protein SEC31
MHPLFGADPNQVSQVPPSNSANPMMMMTPQQNDNYQSQPQQTMPTINNQAMTGFYQSPPAQDVNANNPINYNNFNTFVAPQTQNQQVQREVAPSPPIQQATPIQKPPLPEEFIYLQTVLEELKTQCVNKATNPVRNFFNSNLTMLTI